MMDDLRCEITELPASMCAHCRGLKASTAEEYRREAVTRLDDPDLRHGETLTAYSYGCRCDPCVDLHRESVRTWFARNWGRPA